MSSPSSPHPPVFCAIVDSAYFVGAVALVNSLRLTGHTGEIAFLDVGLCGSERALLEQEATVHDGPRAVGWLSVFAKPTLALLYPDRVVVMLDNDLVITGSLDPLVRGAEEGEVAVFADAQSSRWFAEWEPLFSLRQPLRRQPYANGGCVALSVARWRGFLERWHELGESVIEVRSSRPFLLRKEEVDADPIGFNEQDTLNALLMSEVPEACVRFLPPGLTPSWDARGRVRVVDADWLRCDASGHQPLFLHFTGQPKPWQSWGWLKGHFRAFNRLLTRVLVAGDVPLSLPRERLPLWLRPDLRGRVLQHAAAVLARVAYGSLSIVPTRLRTRVTAATRARLAESSARA